MMPSAHFSPTKAEVRRYIRKLRHLNLRRHPPALLATRMQRLLAVYPAHGLELPAGALFYRGVPAGQRPENVAAVSYPPADRVQHDQRANRAGQPMFYASATWHPPFLEARVQPDDRVVISRWISRKPLRLISFYEPDLCPDDPHSSRDAVLRQTLQELPEPTQLVASFLTWIFTRPVPQEKTHQYRLSIAVAEACGLGSALDGLLYPSAAMPSPAHNLALHPSCLDKGKLELQYVEYLRVNHVAPETIDVCSLDFANCFGQDGQLHWRQQPGNWVLREGGRRITLNATPTVSSSYTVNILKQYKP